MSTSHPVWSSLLLALATLLAGLPVSRAAAEPSTETPCVFLVVPAGNGSASQGFVALHPEYVAALIPSSTRGQTIVVFGRELYLSPMAFIPARSVAVEGAFEAVTRQWNTARRACPSPHSGTQP